MALTEIATRVVGVDASPEMLNRAPRTERIEYVEASAEDLPFGADLFDLVTVASAFHWFDRSRFLSEARRVLRATGRLVIYDNYFLGRMEENTGFEGWFRERYLARYPTPPRDRSPFTDAEAGSGGFRFAGREDYTNQVSFSVEGLADYLTTQSNVVAAVEDGRESIEGVHGWLRDSLGPLLRGRAGTFEFAGYVWYLEPLDVEAGRR